MDKESDDDDRSRSESVYSLHTRVCRGFFPSDVYKFFYSARLHARTLWDGKRTRLSVSSAARNKREAIELLLRLWQCALLRHFCSKRRGNLYILGINFILLFTTKASILV